MGAVGGGLANGVQYALLGVLWSFDSALFV